MNVIVTLLLSLALLLPALRQSPVPIGMEPRHHLEFENQYVRVFYVFIPPGDTTLFHTHINDGVGIKLTDAQIRDEDPGGKREEIRVKRGAVGFTHYSSPLTHRVSNIGSTPFRNIFVEVLPSTRMPSNVPSRANVAGHTLVLENDRVRISRLVLAPGQSTEVHARALRGVRVAISQGKIIIEAQGKKIKTMKFKPGDSQWHEDGMKYSLRNVGLSPFEAVEIELQAAMVPGAKAVVIPNAAHMTTWDNPAATIAAIRQHLLVADSATSKQ